MATEAEDILAALIRTIDATGGLTKDETGNLVPVADTEWLDLADCYLDACELLGRTPMREAEEELFCDVPDSQDTKDIFEYCRMLGCDLAANVIQNPGRIPLRDLQDGLAALVAIDAPVSLRQHYESLITGLPA